MSVKPDCVAFTEIDIHLLLKVYVGRAQSKVFVHRREQQCQVSLLIPVVGSTGYVEVRIPVDTHELPQIVPELLQASCSCKGLVKCCV